MSPGRAALVMLIHRYLGGLMDPFVTLLEIHKLMYFMQEAGEPLRLKYAKAPYGPYAENLRHVLVAGVTARFWSLKEARSCGYPGPAELRLVQKARGRNFKLRLLKLWITIIVSGNLRHS